MQLVLQQVKRNSYTEVIVYMAKVSTQTNKRVIPATHRAFCCLIHTERITRQMLKDATKGTRQLLWWLGCNSSYRLLR